MANITLNIGGQNYPLNNVGDLSTALQDATFSLGPQLDQLLHTQLSQVPQGSTGSLTLDTGNNSWNPAGGAVTFSLDANAAVTITINPKQPLFTYYTDLENTNKATFNGNAGQVYVVTEFTMSLSANGGGQGNVGAVGINGSASTKENYIVQHFKAFPPNTLLLNAILQAFEGFTLPLHPSTPGNLADGDALYYDLDATVNVGFGVTYGISTTVGGYDLDGISSDLKQVSTMADISTSSFTAGANAGVSLSFNWTRDFGCFLSRQNNAQGNTARLQLLNGSNSQSSVGISATAGISNLSANLTLNPQNVENWIAQKLTGNPNAALPQNLATQINAPVQKYISDAQQWVSGLVKKVSSDGSLSLALLFQNSSSNTSCFTWDFNLQNANFNKAWSDAIQGQYVSALTTGAVTLVPGFGFEQKHVRSTKLTLTLFGLGTYTSMDSYYSDTTFTYKGAGVFLLETSVGKSALVSGKNKTSTTIVYLDGSEPSGGASTQPGAAQVQLHGIIDTTGDAQELSLAGNLLIDTGLQLGSGGNSVVALGKTVKNLAANSNTVAGKEYVIHLVFEMSALARLKADEYVKGKQPQPPHPLDRSNWNDYAWASGQLPSAPVTYFNRENKFSSLFYSAYETWAKFNCVVNGITDGDGNPTPDQKTDRRDFGDFIFSPDPSSSTAELNQAFNTNPQAMQPEDWEYLATYFEAGQQYMNLCDDLQVTIAQSSDVNWSQLESRLEQIAQEDLDPWFGLTILLALSKSTLSTTAQVEKNTLDLVSGAGALTINIQ